MAKIMGIDDAGRGPVIGPMILAGVLAEEKDNEIIKSWGAKDSKLLTPKRRKEIKEKVKNTFKNHIEVSSPKEIDDSTNLNYLEAIKTAMIINCLTKDLDEQVTAFIDCPSTNIESWSKDVEKLLKNPKKINLVCEHKADLNHPTVSAASILAKEKREDEIKKSKQELGVNFGSGYPADPKTKDFIRENYNNEKYAKIIRFSWNTVKRLFKEEAQKNLF